MRASPLLPRRTVAKLARRGAGFDARTRAAAARIVEAVRTHGEVALRKHAERFGDVLPDAPLYHDRPELGPMIESGSSASRRGSGRSRWPSEARSVR